MSHFATPEFWQRYRELPSAVRDVADKNFDRMKTTPDHPSLRLKKAGKFWSVRVGKRYRALATEVPEGLLWFWIGNHADYDRLLES